MNILKKTYKLGFTLVELLVVITIIAILVSVSFKAASVMSQKSAIAITSERLAVISACLAEYYAEFGHYPVSDTVRHIGWDESFGKPKTGWSEKKEELKENDPGFDKKGLVYYFINKMDPAKWREFKDHVGLDNWSSYTNILTSAGDDAVTNKVYTLRDGWADEFKYYCEKPGTSYKLYSGGATGSAEDDIHAGQKY